MRVTAVKNDFLSQRTININKQAISNKIIHQANKKYSKFDTNNYLLQLYYI